MCLMQTRLCDSPVSDLQIHFSPFLVMCLLRTKLSVTLPCNVFVADQTISDYETILYPSL